MSIVYNEFSNLIVDHSVKFFCPETTGGNCYKSLLHKRRAPCHACKDHLPSNTKKLPIHARLYLQSYLLKRGLLAVDLISVSTQKVE